MAKALQQGVGSITVWMIVFVALWLTSTVFLVVLYTGQEELNTEIDRLTTAKDRLISPSEDGSIELTRQARPSKEGGPTVVGLLDEARRELTSLASGDDNDDVETIRGRADDLFSQITDDRIVANPGDFDNTSLLEGMDALYAAFKSEHALRQAADDRVKSLEAEVTALVDTNGTQKSEFESRVQEMTTQLSEIEADRNSYREERDASIAQIERNFDQIREQADADLTAARRRSSELAEDLSDMRKRFEGDEEGALGFGPTELATARQADGQVLLAVPGDDVVYIDLGEEDRITLGLQFSVYTADDGLPADGSGKALIEVVSILPSSAACKVVTAGVDEIVIEGDLIANPVFDPNRALQFLVVGEFDLDRDGAYDSDGGERIESLVTAWGGSITTDLTAMTDFVVAGGAPARPRRATGASPEARRRNDALQQAYDRYTSTISSAKSMSVPVMSQDVFLSFLGYRNRLAGL